MNNKFIQYAFIILLLFVLTIAIILPVMMCGSFISFNTSIPLRGMSGYGGDGYTPGQGGTIGDDCIERINSRAKQYVGLVNKYANMHNLDPALVMAVIEQESGFNPNATSPTGAMGLMQLMPGTASDLGVSNAYDPEQNIMGGTKYLSQQYRTFGTIELALAAYNAGPGNVQQYGNTIPPFRETQNYVSRILNQLYPKYKECLEGDVGFGPSISGGYFPLGQGYPLEDPFSGDRNFGATRNNGDRKHAGVDLIASQGAKVYAIKEGTIVNYYEFTGPYMGLNTTYCIFVDHGDYVVNYAEVSNMAEGLSIGSRVMAGQHIGNVGLVSSSAMLHFELYKPGTKENVSWPSNQPQPSALLDPTSLLRLLMNNRVE
jgi:murein DD-endopeptidase MepM/ murein hydrolase activator NlpD